MSETQSYRKILTSIQEHLRSLGSSSRNRWASLSMTPSLSFSAFMDKLKFLGILVTDEEVLRIWQTLGIEGDSLNFVQFLKIMQVDVDTFVPIAGSGAPAPRSPQREYNQSPQQEYNPPPQQEYSEPSHGSGVNLKDSIRRVVTECMNDDIEMKGEIPERTFEDICSGMGISTVDPEFESIVKQNDPAGTGNISYFLLAAQVCQLAPVKPQYDAPQRPRYEAPQKPQYEAQPEQPKSRGVGSETSVAAQGRRGMTSDEEAIINISRQIKGPGWDNVIFKAGGTDDMIRGLANLGIKADELTLRRLSSMMGKTGLIDAIRHKLQ